MMKKALRLTAVSATVALMAVASAALAQKPLPNGPVQTQKPIPNVKPPAYDGRYPDDDNVGPIGPQGQRDYDDRDQGRSSPGGPRRESLYAVEANRNALRVRVSSNGCTKKDDFRVQVSRGRPAEITFTRRTPDRCRSFAMGSAWLEYPYAELRLSNRDSFVIINPITPWTGPGN